SSFEFIFAFLPIVFVVYFVFAQRQNNSTRVWLLLASLFFYGWWNPYNVLLILGSMVFNFFFGRLIGRNRQRWQLALGIGVNLAVLFYYKYVDFFIENVNTLF